MGWALDPDTNTWRRKEEIAAEAQIDAADADFAPEQDEDEDEDENEEEDNNDGDTVELEHTESIHLDEANEGGDEAEYAPPDVGAQAQAPVPPHPLDDEVDYNFFRGYVQHQRNFNDWASMNIYSMRQEIQHLITMQQHNYDSLGVIRTALNLAPQPPMPDPPTFDSPSSSHHTSPASSHPSANPDA